ncbi:hypothetical protein J1N10_13010 [Carboxylicivirga sp. A043]|uniref:leucine-rich repeat domain-containing protein n=1 Tax=Carboxylicivirga litoralis TaxID=2816963 RepID=UPI0021CB3DF1|nr:hypothetical protein [Carboxylicivirga sp. A043]MCU4156901.1 hypothetical protein [Carboxylicivirga sp. A043]
MKLAIQTAISLFFSFVMLNSYAQTSEEICQMTSQKKAGDTFDIFIKASQPTTVIIDFGDNTNQSYLIGTDYTSINGQIGQTQTVTIKGEPANITGLIANNNLLYDIDLSALTNLEELYCGKNKLLNINTSTNKKLVTLDATNNMLLDVDLRNNMNLKDLWLTNNELSNIDINNNKELQILHIAENNLSELSISNNTELQQVYCNRNKISQLDISKNKRLHALNCKSNLLEDLEISANKELIYLAFCFNRVTVFNVNDNPNLADVWCAGNQLEVLNLKNCDKLNNLVCPKNKLTPSSLSLPDAMLSELYFMDQDFINIQQVIAIDDFMDLHTYGIPNHDKLRMVWKTTDNQVLVQGIDYTSKEGRVRFIREQNAKVYCEITHSDYNNMLLQTTTIRIANFDNPIRM